MKKLAFTPILACMIATSFFQSCSKIEQALTYDIPMQTGIVTITIPPTTAGSGYASGASYNTLNVDSVIKASTAHTLGVGNIRSIKLTAATLLINDADAKDNFQNFSNLNISFSTSESPKPYQIVIPENPNIYASVINLPVDTAQELKSYINGNQFSYSFGGQLRTSTINTLNCQISFSFNIQVHE